MRPDSSGKGELGTMGINRTTVAALAGATALLAGGGAALAGEGGPDRSARCEERLARIAERHGMSVAELEARVKAQLRARVDAGLEAGRISTERAAALRQRIEEGSLCPGRRHGPVANAARGMLRAAAGYLGLTKTELRAQRPGTSLTALAEKQGKSVADLETAMVAPGREKIAKALAAGRITRAQADTALERLEEMADKLAAKVFPAKP